MGGCKIVNLENSKFNTKNYEPMAKDLTRGIPFEYILDFEERAGNYRFWNSDVIYKHFPAKFNFMIIQAMQSTYELNKINSDLRLESFVKNNLGHRMNILMEYDTLRYHKLVKLPDWEVRKDLQPIWKNVVDVIILFLNKYYKIGGPNKTVNVLEGIFYLAHLFYESGDNNKYSISPNSSAEVGANLEMFKTLETLEQFLFDDEVFILGLDSDDDYTDYPYSDEDDDEDEEY